MISSIVSAIRYLLAPRLCGGCKSFLINSSIICVSCARLIKPLVSYEMRLSATRSVWVYAAGAYDMPLRQLINAKHYGDVLAAQFLGQLICEYTPVLELPFDYIVPVPLHWMRKMQRGYNQAEIMAYEISRQSGVPLLPLVQRVRRTGFQFLLPKRLRVDNVSHAFCINQQLDAVTFSNSKFLLVDDLMTTGATLSEVARTIAHAVKGVEITAVVVSRVV